MLTGMDMGTINIPGGYPCHALVVARCFIAGGHKSSVQQRWAALALVVSGV